MRYLMTFKKVYFEVSERKVLLRLMDVGMILFALYLLNSSTDFDYLVLTFEYGLALSILLVYFIAFGTIFEIYDLQTASRTSWTFRALMITVSVTVLIYVLTPFFTPLLPSKQEHIFYFFFMIGMTTFVGRLAYIYLIRAPRFCKNVVLIGDINCMQPLLSDLIHTDPEYRIVGYINGNPELEVNQFTDLVEFQPKDLNQIIKKHAVTQLLIGTLSTEGLRPEVYDELLFLWKKGYKVKCFMQVYEQVTHQVPIVFAGKEFYKMFPFSRSHENTLYLLGFRCFNVVISVLGLAFGLLILPFIWIGNVIANPGPLFYRQERVGKNSKVFTIIKLRTMIDNAERSGEQWAQKNDVRVTKFGRFLRRSRMDEIPQFFNVLKGEMSLIGPRPERPFFVKQLSDAIPYYQTRHLIKPGLTGWAQVKSRYSASVTDNVEKLQYDLYYIKHRSIFLDLNVLVKTLSTIVYYRGQ